MELHVRRKPLQTGQHNCAQVPMSLPPQHSALQSRQQVAQLKEAKQHKPKANGMNSGLHSFGEFSAIKISRTVLW
eukprot:5927465-Amphidinium_carterae.2